MSEFFLKPAAGPVILVGDLDLGKFFPPTVIFAEWRGIEGSLSNEESAMDQDTFGMNEALASPTQTSNNRETSRQMLYSQLRSAEQEVRDLNSILDMLPAKMSVEQNTALRRLLSR